MFSRVLTFVGLRPAQPRPTLAWTTGRRFRRKRWEIRSGTLSINGRQYGSLHNPWTMERIERKLDRLFREHEELTPDGVMLIALGYDAAADLFEMKKIGVGTLQSASERGGYASIQLDGHRYDLRVIDVKNDEQVRVIPRQPINGKWIL